MKRRVEKFAHLVRFNTVGEQVCINSPDFTNGFYDLGYVKGHKYPKTKWVFLHLHQPKQDRNKTEPEAAET